MPKTNDSSSPLHHLALRASEDWNKRTVDPQTRKRERTKSVGPGAIVIIGSDRQSFNVSTKAGSEDEIVFSEPFSCVDILGRSVVERTIDRLLCADAEAVSVLVAADVADAVRSLSGKWENVRFQAVPDIGL